MGWEFAAILGGALVVSLLLGLWQQGRYARSVNALVLKHRGPGLLLVTGRGLGKLKGTIVMLVIDDAADEVVAASTLRGSTVFATAKDAPGLLGPVATLAGRAADKQTGKAIDMALNQPKATRARVHENKVITPARPAGRVTRKVQR